MSCERSALQKKNAINDKNVIENLNTTIYGSINFISITWIFGTNRRTWSVTLQPLRLRTVCSSTLCNIDSCDISKSCTKNPALLNGKQKLRYSSHFRFIKPEQNTWGKGDEYTTVEVSFTKETKGLFGFRKPFLFPVFKRLHKTYQKQKAIKKKLISLFPVQTFQNRKQSKNKVTIFVIKVKKIVFSK